MAARNISEIQELVADIIRLERGAFVTFAQVDNWLHMSQLDLEVNYWKEYLATGVLPQALEPFKSRVQFTLTTSVGGLVTKPATYGRFLNGYTITFDNTRSVPKRNKLTPVNEDEVVNALNSQVRPVSRTYPLLVQGASKFVLYPQEPQAGEINYLSMPVAPVFAYTQIGRVVTYDAANSVQLLWSDVYINDVILGALSYIGINLNSQDITTYAEQKQAEVK